VFLNASPEDGINDVCGVLPAKLIDAVVDELAHTTGCIFLHYPVLPLDAPWTDPVVNGDVLHAHLRPFADRIAGVFFGHIHRSTQQMLDGILYVAAPSSARHFLFWPGQEEWAGVDDDIVGYHYVTLGRYGTCVQHHTFMMPSA